MFYSIHQSMAVTALSLGFILTAQADSTQFDCEKSLIGCGIVFTAIPATPALAVASTASATYTIQNQAASATNIALSLTELDSLDDPGAITIDGSSTCPNPGSLASSASCNIVLDFQPSVAGALSWTLTVTPTSSQAPFSLPIQATVGSPPNAYVVNNAANTGDAGTVSLCSLNGNGTFGQGNGNACLILDLGETDSGYMFEPWGIAYNSVGPYAYIANSDDGASPGSNIRICPVNEDGTFGTCFDATRHFQNPAGLALNAAGTSLYVTTSAGASGPGNNHVLSCPIDSGTGDLTEFCTTLASGLDNPQSIAFNSSYTLAYVAGINTVWVYRVDGSGNFTLANTYSDSNIGFGGGIKVDAADANMYVTSLSHSTVLVCPLSSGIPSSCTPDTANGLLSEAAGVWLDNNRNIYITNLTEGSGGDVTFCQLNIDGTINDSTCANLTDPSFENPSSMVIAR